MNVEHLRDFLSLANHLNYTRAAKERFISQPALSKHIDALEKEIGVKLVERNPANVRNKSVDACITGHPSTNDMSGLTETKLYEEPLVVIVGKSHPLAGRGELRLQTLTTRRCSCPLHPYIANAAKRCAKFW